jgi:transposase-like protein
MKQRKTRRIFSESFKKEKVQMLENGEIKLVELTTTYNLSGSTVEYWRKKYGKLPAGEKIVIEKDSDFIKVLELNKKVAELERIIGRQQIKLDYCNTVITHASSHYNEDIEKKFGPAL